MSEILANIVVDQTNINFSPDTNNLNVTPEAIQLNIFTAAAPVAGGPNTSVQYSNGGVLEGSLDFVFDISNNTVIANLLEVTSEANLGNVGNVKISGGSLNQVLVTDGNGNLNFSGTTNITSVGTLTSLSVAGNISAGNVSATTFTGALSGAATTAGTVTTAAQPNITSLGTLTGLTVTGTSNLGNVGNVKITGGTNGFVLQTDGAGNLDWTAMSGGGGNGSPGGSNTQIQYNDSGLFGGASGFTFNEVSGNVAIPGSLSVTGNANVGNIGGTTGVFTSIEGTVTTAAQPNITSLGTLTSLTVSGNLESGNANLGNLAIANFFQGDGGLLSNINVANLTGDLSRIANGTSNVSIPSANGNITFSAGGVANIAVISNTALHTSNLRLSSNTIILGANTPNSLGGSVIVIGDGAGNSLTGGGSVVIGSQAGQSLPGAVEGAFNVIIGSEARQFASGNVSVTVGSFAGRNSNAAGSVFLGYSSGQAANGIGSVGVGYRTLATSASPYQVAIGYEAGANKAANRAADGSIAIGYRAARGGQGSSSIAIGNDAAPNGQGTSSIAIGQDAGGFDQGNAAIAIGQSAGGNQSINAIGIGFNAGGINQGINAIALGVGAGAVNQAANSIAIGAGGSITGANSIAIGASIDMSANNSIALSGTGVSFAANIANAFFVKPIRNAKSGNVLYYNSTSGEITFDNATYGCFHKIANVTAAAANTVYNFDWYTDTTVHVSQGITVTSGQPTRVNIDTAGNYSVFVEMQAKNTDNQDRTAWVWLSKNGTPISETTVKITLLKEWAQVIAKQWTLDNIAANDYIEVNFAVNNTSGISLEYNAAQTTPFIMPAQPSATLTITPIGA